VIARAAVFERPAFAAVVRGRCSRPLFAAVVRGRCSRPLFAAVVRGRVALGLIARDGERGRCSRRERGRSFAAVIVPVAV
jgi:hypothetical protein